MPPKTTSFVFEKSTKNTHKFNEEPADGSAPIIGSLYLQKWAVPSAGPGTRLTVTVQSPKAAA